MTEKDSPAPANLPKSVTRRTALRTLGVALAAAPLTQVLGCDDEEVTDLSESSTGGSSATGGTTNSATGGTDGSTGGSTAETTGGNSETTGATGGADEGTGGESTTSNNETGITDDGWAYGGTAAMTDLANYPNPFETVVDTACAITCSATLGPCHDDLAPEREDISEGKGGLPMRFGLRVLDDTCTPITDANVDIWHCDAVGVYSSESSDNPGYCTGDNAEALAAQFFRGHTQTDEDGVAWFNTCFPGWYSSRAIHIHFTVRRSTRDGDEYLTSQVGWLDAFNNEICSTHPEYSEHGLPDTTNSTDNVFPADGFEDYMMETERMSDGALLSWKTVIIRSSLDDATCGDSNSAGGGGGGGGGDFPGGGTPPGN